MKTDDLLNQAKRNNSESSISFADQDLADEQEAARIFSLLRRRVLDIAGWNKHSLFSTYELFDENGGEIADGKIAVGVFIRIALKASGKYDWIRVINFSEDEKEFVITVKPTFDPTAEKTSEKVISHFFTDESTNNFCLFRKGKTVAFYIIGLDEKPNTGETGGALETVRNVAVNIGTYLGIQKSEWEKFCRHFLSDAAAEIEDAATNVKN